MKKPKTIRVLLANNSPLIRLGLKTALEQQQDINVVAETGDCEEAVEITANLHPDIVIVDIDLPTLGGFEVTQQIAGISPESKVLLFSIKDQSVKTSDISESGAYGYITSLLPTDVTVHMVRKIHSEKQPSTTVMKRDNFVDDSYINSPVVLRKPNELTSRESNVLKFIADGMTNKEIARNLDITLPTVKTIITSLFIKLNVSSRTQAIAVGLRTGILNISDLGQ